ncbi:MAG: ATP-dependent Clp protease proteolytic subunit, partial [Bacilli bacterium]|nr:ATP-dependent Clp protease proteolytic subunit [Bacilli bacterium]
MLTTPGVTYIDPNGNERYMDLATRAYKDRIIFLQGEINAEMAASIVMQLYVLESEAADKPIKMIIQSPGGEITSGYAIIDVMNKIKCPVHTQATGTVA